MSNNKEEDDADPESIEEAGILEADVGAHFDQQLSGIDPKLKINMDPQAHRDLRPEMMFIREELRQAKWQTLAITAAAGKGGIDGRTCECGQRLTYVRRAALKKLLMKDFLEEDCELKNLGLSYAPPDP